MTDMKHYRRIALFVLSAALLLSFTGCADMRDINERAYVIGIGADPVKDGGWQFTFCCYLPRLPGASATGEKMTTDVICCEAASMAEAVRRLDQSTSRETVLEQLACIAIGSHPDCEELGRLLDYPLREPQVRRQAVVVASGCSARELMSAEPGEGSAPAAIASLLAQQGGSGRRAQSDALYRVGQLLADGCDIMLQRVGLAEDGGATSGSDSTRRLVLDGAEVWSGGEYRGSLSEAQAETAGLITGGTAAYVMTVTGADGEKKLYEIRPTSHIVMFDVENGEAVFRISLEAEYVAADLGTGTGASREEISEALLLELESLAELCRERLGSAPLELETAARQQRSRWYARSRASWPELFASCTVRLHVDCTPAAGQSVDIRAVT